MPNRYSFHVLIPKSSAISAVAYDADTFELSVTFRSGRTWIYTNVPGEFARGLRDAKSKGAYFRENIRGQFRGSIDHGEVPEPEDLQEKLRQSIEAAKFRYEVEEDRAQFARSMEQLRDDSREAGQLLSEMAGKAVRS